MLGYSTSFDDLISLKDMNKGVLKSGDIGQLMSMDIYTSKNIAILQNKWDKVFTGCN